MILLTALTFCSVPVTAQNSLSDSVPVSAENFKLDILGNIYWVEGNTLNKYRIQDQQVMEYNNAFLGTIHTFDVTNPMKILVYHDEYNQLQYLDKNLSELSSPLSLDQINPTQVKAICSSQKGGMWILNQSSEQIEYYDRNLRLINATVPPEILLSSRFREIQLIEKHNMLYAFLPGCCLLSFDLYGNFSQKHPLKNVDNIQIINENILYFYEGALNSYSLNTLKTTQVTTGIPEGNWDLIKTSKAGKVYALKGDKIFIYK